MLVEQENIIEFLGADHETETNIVSSIQDGVEKWIKDYCRKNFESDDYAEYYDGDGNEFIQLDHYPVTALVRIATGRRTAIKIKNTSASTWATVSVNSTGVVLTKDGTSDSTIIFETYTTMSTVISAINALGSGWTAEIYDSDYNPFKSSELIQMFGKNVIEDNWVYLDMPEEAIDNFEVYPNRGEIYMYAGWPSGHRNIYIEYTAGYATIPDDLQLAVKIICNHIFQKQKEETFGINSYSIGDIRVASESNEFPKEAIDILSKYRRILI